MVKLSKGKTQYAWDKENAVFIGVKLMRSTDSDIIEYLNRHGKQPEIKRLIRQAIAAEKEESERTPFDY